MADNNGHWFWQRHGGAKDSALEKPMRWLGFRSWANWTPQEYTAFLTENGWYIRRCDVISAGFDIAYVVAQAL